MNVQHIPSGHKMFYTSAKFRDLLIHKTIHDKPLPEFPTNKNFFLSDYTEALSYGTMAGTRVNYYLSNCDIYRMPNLNVTHVYEVIKPLRLLKLMDQHNIKTLLFDDPRSPFHISNIDINVMRGDEIKNIMRRHRRQIKEFSEKHIDKDIVINPYSAFALLLIATGYLFGMKRESSIFYDYILANLLKTYFDNNSQDIDGWYQSSDTFHTEYGIFKPYECLRNLTDHPLGWRSNYDGSLDPLRKFRALIVNLDALYAFKENNIRREIQLLKDQLNDLYEDVYEDDEEMSRYIDMGYTEKDARELLIKRDIDILQGNMDDLIQSLRDRVTVSRHDFLKFLKKEGKIRSIKPNSVQRYYNKTNGYCKFQACSKPLSFESCQNELQGLLEEMRHYKNKIDTHHVGATVADHSIWVLRTMYNWLGYMDHPWTDGILFELRNATLLAAFLHDIGKIGDKDTAPALRIDHPYRGFLYLNDRLTFKCVEKECSKLSDLIGYNITDDVKTILSVVSAMHQYLGNLLMTVNVLRISDMERANKIDFPHSFNYNHFITDLPDTYRLHYILNYITEFKYIAFYLTLIRHLYDIDRERTFINNWDNMEQLLLILLAVSASDTFGSYPVEDIGNSRYDTQFGSILDPQVLYADTNLGEGAVVIDVLRPYYKYLYHTIGLSEKDKLLSFCKTVKDPIMFMMAWNSYPSYIKALLSNKEVPDVYIHLNSDDPQTYARDLLRLLKSGSITHDVRGVKGAEGATDGKSVRLLPSGRVTGYLLSEPEPIELKPGGDMYSFCLHRHPGFSDQAPF